MTISTVYPDWLNDPVNGFSAATRIGYRDRIRTLVTTVGDKPVGDVTEDDLVAAIVVGDVSNGYKKTRMVTYRSFFSWLSWKGMIESNPAEHLSRIVKLTPQPVREHTWLTAADVHEFLDKLPTDTPVDRRNRALFYLGFTTGLRRRELVSLTWSKVALDRSEARVVGKGGKLATVFLYPGTVDVLGEWKAEGPGEGYVLPPVRSVLDFDGTARYYTVQWERSLSPSWVSTTVRRVSEEMGHPLSPHDMRRSYAGMVQDTLGDIVKVQAALRHSNVGTTQRYLETRQDAAMLAGKEAALGF